MPIELRDAVLLREAEQARIARWFDDVGGGAVFHSDDGEALAIADHERDLYYMRAMRALDAYLAGRRSVPLQTLALAVLLMASFAAARAIVQRWVPTLATIPAPFAGIGACAWPVVQDALYRRRLARLQREMTERLCLRTDIPRVGRRHNAFAAAAAAVGLGVLGIGMAGVARHDETFGLTAMVALVPIAWGLHWAGRRVDRVHRRPHETHLR